MARKRKGPDDSHAGAVDRAAARGAHASEQSPAAMAAAWKEQMATEAARLQAEIERLEGRLASREIQLEAKIRRLESQNQAQTERILRLEADLEDARQHPDAKEFRPGRRLSLVGQNLHRVGPASDSKPTDSQSSDQLLDPALLDPAMLFDADGVATGYPALSPFDIGSADDEFADGITDLGLDFDQTPSDERNDHAPRKRRKMLPLHDTNGTEYEIAAAHVTIGRSRNCDICIRDTSVSRKHARLFETGDCVIIEDDASTNGILVNEQRVHRAVLHHGDIVSLGGRYDLRYVEEHEES